ncbi:MAG: transketolase [Thermoplasmatales archaeon]
MQGSIEIPRLEEIAKEVRKLIVEMTYEAKSGHPGGSLSATEILTYLYFKEMNIDPSRPDWEDRDRFVLSKGHATPVLYSVLALRGFFDKNLLHTFRRINSPLQGHAVNHVPGVDITAGSLGQGLSNAIGLALGARIDGKKYRVFAMIGDGESDEGSIWEAALFAAHQKISNLIVFLDRNMIQLDGFTEEILALGDLEEKFRSFGWSAITINGHSFYEIGKAMEWARERSGPKIIIARTIKGKGVSYMENNPEYHGKPPPSEEKLKEALREIEGD